MRYTFLLFILFLIACHGSHHDREMLDEAEPLVDSIPNEALTLLQSVKNSGKLSQSERARYHLLLTRAWMNSGTRPPTDSLVDKAIDYYKETKDSVNLFNALYTKGRYFFRYAKHDSALYYFSLAETILPLSSDNEKRMRTQRISGFTNLYLGNTHEAIKNQQTALRLLSDSADNEQKIYALLNLGQAYAYGKDTIHAKKVYYDALELALKSNRTDIQSALFNHLSNIFAGEKNYKKALDYKKKEHALRVNRKEIPARNLAQAMLFDKQHMPDSTRYYLELAIQGNDNIVADIAYGLLSDWYANQGLYNEALLTWRKRGETTSHLQSGINTTMLQHEFEREKLRNENNELKIKQKEKDILLLVILLLVFVVSVVLFFFFWQQKKKREAYLLQTKAMQLEQENLVLKQQKEISVLREKEASLRESFFRRINLFDKIPSLHTGELHENGLLPHAYPKIKMTVNDWTELTRSLNEAYPGFIEQLKYDYPALTKEDISFCCLLKINVNLQDLSEIYCVTKSAITKRKYRIKTEKLHLQDNTVDLDTFLQKIY